MNCPDCDYNCEQHVTHTRTFRRCLRVGCNWQQTIPHQKPKIVVEHHREADCSTGRLLSGWFLERVLRRKTR